MIQVVVNGTFDIVHLGHLALLNFAKSQGDRLVVAIDSDRRVQELKGTKRPINNQSERKTLLENLRAVDEVRIFNSDKELIDIIARCDIMVKGSDYRGKTIVGATYCKNLIYFERLDDYSTTNKIQHIISR